MVLDDYASRQVTPALQRYEAPDADIALDIHVGADHASPPDDGAATNEDEISDSGIRSDLDTLVDDAVLAIDAINLNVPTKGCRDAV